MIVILLKMEQNGTEHNINEMIEEKEWEQNDLAEGPHSKMKRKDLKKVGTCFAPSKWAKYDDERKQQKSWENFSMVKTHSR